MSKIHLDRKPAFKNKQRDIARRSQAYFPTSRDSDPGRFDTESDAY
jgi:hypothetical protein